MKFSTGTRVGAVVLLALVGACAPMAGPAVAAAARTVPLLAGDGKAIGEVAVAAGGAMRVRVLAGALPAGVHGMHLHETGLCTGPGFASAGGHLNPGGKQHGKDNPLGAHLGDLPNIEIDPATGGMASIPAVGAVLADADGTALVIHAKADDYKTDPSGNSGDRIACAVIAPAR